MIKVLYNLKIIKISHLDIKPENILVKITLNKYYNYLYFFFQFII